MNVLYIQTDITLLHVDETSQMYIEGNCVTSFWCCPEKTLKKKKKKYNFHMVPHRYTFTDKQTLC